MMNKALHIFILLSTLAVLQAAENLCQTPKLQHGHVIQKQPQDRDNVFNGEFYCDPGFTLSGAAHIKCRDGVWSAKLPVCIGN